MSIYVNPISNNFVSHCLINVKLRRRQIIAYLVYSLYAMYVYHNNAFHQTKLVVRLVKENMPNINFDILV